MADYLKERLALISDDNNDAIKQFKGKLVDTVYLHHDTTATIDRLEKLRTELDDCVFDKATRTSIRQIQIVCTALFYTFLVCGILGGGPPFIGLLCLFFYRRCSKKDNKHSRQLFDGKVNELKDICDVVIHLYNKT